MPPRPPETFHTPTRSQVLHRVNQHYLELHRQLWTIAGLSSRVLVLETTMLSSLQGWEADRIPSLEAGRLKKGEEDYLIRGRGGAKARSSSVVLTPHAAY